LATAAPAADLYTGSLFRAAWRHCARAGDPIYILSARHGLLAADAVVEPYEAHMLALRPEARRSWGRDVVRALKGAFPGAVLELVVHAAAPYVDPLRAPLPEGWTIHAPLAGLGLYQRMAFYKRQEDAASSAGV
jgi:hypothetical protein